MKRHTLTERYQNMLIIGAGFTVLGLGFSFEPLLWVAFIVALTGLLSGWASDRLIYGWHKLGHTLGYVNSRIILSIVFIGVLTPIALLYRFTRKKEIATDSYFITRNHLYTPKDMEKGW
jgi:uncharacterized membrane protein